MEIGVFANQHGEFKTVLNDDKTIDLLHWNGSAWDVADTIEGNQLTADLVSGLEIDERCLAPEDAFDLEEVDV